MISGTTTAAAAGTFRLGQRTVNRLGFGAMRLTGTGGMGRGEDRDPVQSAAVVRRAVELGVNHIDTAGFYFSATGRANVIIRDALAPYPHELTVVTKVGPGRDLVTGEWGDWLRPEQLRQQRAGKTPATRCLRPTNRRRRRRPRPCWRPRNPSPQ